MFKRENGQTGKVHLYRLWPKKNANSVGVVDFYGWYYALVKDSEQAILTDIMLCEQFC